MNEDEAANAVKDKTRALVTPRSGQEASFLLTVIIHRRRTSAYPSIVTLVSMPFQRKQHHHPLRWYESLCAGWAVIGSIVAVIVFVIELLEYHLEDHVED